MSLYIMMILFYDSYILLTARRRFCKADDDASTASYKESTKRRMVT